jgi:uncharacterized protein (UPF0332 family)
VIDPAMLYLIKAAESLSGAESEFANDRPNNCANRCYYACFQAAVAALIQEGIRPAGTRAQWSHAFVPAQFAGQLVIRRKLYPAGFRDVLPRNYALRQTADYDADPISQRDAARALRRTRDFVAAIRARRGETP